jgi:hypothetical protein
MRIGESMPVDACTPPFGKLRTCLDKLRTRSDRLMPPVDLTVADQTNNMTCFLSRR